MNIYLRGKFGKKQKKNKIIQMEFHIQIFTPEASMASRVNVNIEDLKSAKDGFQSRSQVWAADVVQ